GRGDAGGLLVGVDELHADGCVWAQRVDDGAQRVGGSSGPADHPPQVVGVDPNLEHVTAAQRAQPPLDVVGVVDDPPHEVIQRIDQHHSLLSAASSAGASSAGASSAGSSVAVASSVPLASAAFALMSSLSSAAC